MKIIKKNSDKKPNNYNQIEKKTKKTRFFIILSNIKQNFTKFKYLCKKNLVLSVILFLLTCLVILFIFQTHYGFIYETANLLGMSVDFYLLTQLILVINIYLILLLSFYFRKQKYSINHRFYFNESILSTKLSKFLQNAIFSKHFYNIAILVLFSLVISALAIYYYKPNFENVKYHHLISRVLVLCIAVPIVEEILFRGYLSAILYKLTKNLTPKLSFLSILASIMIFSILHSYPFMTISHEIFLVTAPPFMLAFVCEIARSLKAKWYLVIGNHILANSSSVLFSLISPDIFNVLSFFYR